MTLTQFLEILSTTDRTWHLTDGRLRQDDRWEHDWKCPMTAVAEQQGLNEDRLGAAWASLVARNLLLPALIATEIILAADGETSTNDLRQQLLRACGVVDVTEAHDPTEETHP